MSCGHSASRARRRNTCRLSLAPCAFSSPRQDMSLARTKRATAPDFMRLTVRNTRPLRAARLAQRYVSPAGPPHARRHEDSFNWKTDQRWGVSSVWHRNGTGSRINRVRKATRVIEPIKNRAQDQPGVGPEQALLFSATRPNQSLKPTDDRAAIQTLR